VRKKTKLSTPIYGCIKTSFDDAFVPDTEETPYRARILDLISKAHDLAHHATHALKFYVLRAKAQLPVTKTMVEAIIHILNNGDEWRPTTADRIALKTNLLPIMKQYQKAAGISFFGLEHAGNTVQYLATEIYTNIEVNVKVNFVKMLSKYINLRMNTKAGAKLPKCARDAFFARRNNLKKRVFDPAAIKNSPRLKHKEA
jgi:hypothetical protein